MVTRPDDGATSESPAAPSIQVPECGPTYSPSTLYQLEIAVLKHQVATLESELERREQQRQALVDRYERLLEGR
jgi:hypothetical protein